MVNADETNKVTDVDLYRKTEKTQLITFLRNKIPRIDPIAGNIPDIIIPKQRRTQAPSNELTVTTRSEQINATSQK
jgi:hypothetical protein